MVRLRQETEVDRTEAALARFGVSLPLGKGTVHVLLPDRSGATLVGQRIATVLVNELARMKGVVSTIHVTGAEGYPVLPGVPLRGSDLAAGLQRMVSSFNLSNDGPLASRLNVTSPIEADVTVAIGTGGGKVNVHVGADGWRGLLGEYVARSEWNSSAPYGSGLAAALAAAEVFKEILVANAVVDSSRQRLQDLSFSLFNYGVNGEAAEGPELSQLAVRDFGVVGCGAGGTAALYVLGMQPGLSGTIALIEPGHHKLSNLNRYLMTCAVDVHEPRHKLGSVANHLATFAPGLTSSLHPVTWEMLESPPWSLLLSTVDTIPARWAIQRRAIPEATILDAAVLDLLYSVLRVTKNGRCLECKHPYDSDHDIKQRAARWGQSLDIVREWHAQNVPVTATMIAALAETQNRPPSDFTTLDGVPFRETAPMIECGETALSTDVPSQAPVLPLATTAAGVVLAAEVAKHFFAVENGLNNWIGHDLARAPARPKVKWRPPVDGCPRHSIES